MSLNPITREEKFLAKAGGEDVGELKPITRKEKFLNRIAGGGGGGGAGSWEELGEEKGIGEILPETTIALPIAQGSATSSEEDIKLTTDPILGKIYTVTWDGVDYECEYKSFELDPGAYSYYLGNIYKMFEMMGMPADIIANSGVVDTKEPFVLMKTGGAFGVMSIEGLGTVTLKITGETTVYHPIPTEYLPEEVATKDYVNQVIGGIANGTY